MEPQPPGTYRHILVAIDGSEAAGRATDRAVALARALGARLSIVAVVELARFPLITPETPAMVADLQDQAEQAVGEAVARSRAAGVEPAERRVVEGDVRAAIVATARALGADLIVVGSHGWSALERLLLGSTADYLVRNAPCSVLVVRPPPAE